MNYLSKRAWGDEYAFSQFNSVMLGWIRDTKRVYDSTLFNSYIGTAVAEGESQNIVITLTADAGDIEATARVQAGEIAEEMSNILVNLEDVSRDYNDYGNLRSYKIDDLVFVWNSAIVNKIQKRDLPTIFHKDKLIDKFAEYTLPARYWGNVNVDAGTGNGTTIRSLVEKDYGATHCFPGDIIPNGEAYLASESYTVDPTIAFKVMHKRSVPFMSAFEVGTSFFNPKSLKSIA